MVVCKVHIVNGDENKIAKVLSDECLVADRLEPQPKTGMSVGEYDSHLHRAKAFIQNTGGFTNHANMVARASGKPSISGVVGISQVEATTLLVEGQKIVVEGYSGDVQKYKTDGTPYMVKLGSVYEWVPGPDEPAGAVPSPQAKPSIGDFNMAEFLKTHGQKPKGG